MATSLVIEEERGTCSGHVHPHNGYYAGNFSGNFSGTLSGTLAGAFASPAAEARRGHNVRVSPLRGLRPVEADAVATFPVSTKGPATEGRVAA